MGDHPGGGYHALRQGAALLDLTGRGKIRVTGEDRARLLHAMTTNHVEQLGPGQGCYAFFLNAQGRILADVHVLSPGGHFLLDTEPETARRVAEHLDKYIIADDVTLEDRTAEVATLAVEGPQAAALLASLGLPVPEAPYSIAAHESLSVARLNAAGGDGFFLFVPAAEKQALFERLVSAGAVPASAEDWRVARIENGKPRYGEEFSDANLPQETQLMHALHFSKGCYIGQEIVERIRSRGHVNRLLCRLRLETDTPPPAGTRILREGKDSGELMSTVWSPTAGAVLGFGYLKAEAMRTTEVFDIAGSVAKLVRK
jgi:aminomethyltransferase